MENAQTSADRESLLAIIKSESPSTVRRIVLWHKDIYRMVMFLQPVEALANALGPSALLDAKIDIWGGLSTFIYGGIAQLMYIVCQDLSVLSECFAPEAEADVVAMLDLFNAKAYNKDLFDWAVAEKLVGFMDVAFKSVCEKDGTRAFFQLFGAKDAESVTALQDMMAEYHTELWRLVDREFDFDDEPSRVVAELQDRLETCFLSTTGFSCGLIPSSGVAVPGLSPTYIQTMRDIFKEIAAPATLVSRSFFSFI
jgi:hypothetical protein